MSAETQALKLLREWFRDGANPYYNDDYEWYSRCIFCGNTSNVSHDKDCFFVKAKRILEESENKND